MQAKDVRKTKRRGSQRDTSIKRCAMKRTKMRKRKWLQLKDEEAVGLASLVLMTLGKQLTFYPVVCALP